MMIDIQRYWGEQELYFVGELCSRIVEGMQKDHTVTLFSKEPRSAEASGLYFLLDQMCEYHHWDKSKIILITPNYLESHQHYTIELMGPDKLSRNGQQFLQLVKPFINHRPWNHEKTYGMFLGRANVTRIYGVYKHKNFEFRDQGVVSWHHNLRDHVDQPVLTEYLMSTNQTYEQMISLTPFSDIGTVTPPPITDVTAGNVDWNSVYEKIGIELVFATSESNLVTAVCEKILRPMLFKRPFMLIGGQFALRNLKEVWAKKIFGQTDPSLNPCFFENVISPAYDHDCGIWRVEHMFDILHELIRTNKIKTILEDCQTDIENNYKFALACQAVASQSKQNLPYDFDSWGKPNFTNVEQ
jgi:hypothetical protein